MKTTQLAKPYVVKDGQNFRLKHFDTGDTLGLKDESRQEAQKHLQRGVVKLAELQDKLYAQDQWALLLIFQAMDAAGKDSTIKHVMSGVNPQGCQVYSFKAPSVEEIDHDYLWRTMKCVPERGRIGIFNRSYYEEVLVVRVHPELLAKERIPQQLIGKKLWQQRFEDINNFERYLARNGVAILKFFLHVSKEEQQRRFLKRLNDPAKNWKFSAADVEERKRFDEYMDAYEDMIRNTASRHAPWFIIPADHKWFARMVVASAVVDALEDLNVAYPKVGEDKKKELRAARQALESEGKK